jgi:hypothetical protein
MRKMMRKMMRKVRAAAVLPLGASLAKPRAVTEH